MCIIFTCGEQTFRKDVEGYEGIVCRCYNCGNYSGHVLKSHSWFTFCFIVGFFLSLYLSAHLPAWVYFQPKSNSSLLTRNSPQPSL